MVNLLKGEQISVDPDAKIQVATMGTKLEYSTTGAFSGEEVRIYGLASTPDFGGEPNTIDTTTLDNTEYETNTLGLQSADTLSYELNVMDINSNEDATNNLVAVHTLAKNKTVAYWRLTKASGTTFTYQAITKIQYNADEQSSIEKITMYHSLKSAVDVNVPS